MINNINMVVEKNKDSTFGSEQHKEEESNKNEQDKCKREEIRANEHDDIYNEDNDSIETVKSEEKSNENNGQIKKDEQVSLAPAFTQGPQASRFELNNCNTDNRKQKDNNDVVENMLYNFNVNSGDHINNKNSQNNRQAQNILDPIQLQQIRNSKQGHTTVTLLLAPMMAKTKFSVPVYRFSSQSESLHRHNSNIIHNEDHDYYSSDDVVDNGEGWVLIAKELYESAASHLCVHPQSFILYRRFISSEEKENDCDTDRIRFMSILFLNNNSCDVRAQNNNSNNNSVNITVDAEKEKIPYTAEPLWLTLYFNPVQTFLHAPVAEEIQECNNEYSEEVLSNTHEACAKESGIGANVYSGTNTIHFDNNIKGSSNDNIRCNMNKSQAIKKFNGQLIGCGSTSSVPAHLSCLKKNEMLVRCLLVRRRLPEIDPSKLAALREQLQRERDYEYLQRIEQEKIDEANRKWELGEEDELLHKGELTTNVSSTTFQTNSNLLKRHHITYEEIIRNVHDLVKVASSETNNTQTHMPNLRVITRDVGVGDDANTHTRLLSQGHSAATTVNANGNSSTDNSNEFTTIVSVLYADNDNTIEGITPPYLGGYCVKRNPSQRYVHASTQLFMKELDYSPFAHRRIAETAVQRKAENIAPSLLLRNEEKMCERTNSCDVLTSLSTGVEKVPIMISRQTQTLGISKSIQTRREGCVQTPHTELYLKKTMCDDELNRVNVIVARPYFTAAELTALRTRAVIKLQQCYRQWHARRIRHELEQAKIDEQRRAERRQAMEEEFIRANEQLRRQRRTDPRSMRDFRERQAAIAEWASTEASLIHAQFNNGTLTEHERQAALLAISKQELKLIQELQARQQCMSVMRKEEQFLTTLSKAASAKQWGNVQVETPLTQRASELQALYIQLQETSTCNSSSNYDERLDVLLHVKWTVKEFASETVQHSAQVPHSNEISTLPSSSSQPTVVSSTTKTELPLLKTRTCNSHATHFPITTITAATTTNTRRTGFIDELCQLIDREADLLNRHRSVRTMAHLRSRILFLFKEFVENPQFNPSMAAFSTSALSRVRAAATLSDTKV